MDTVVLQLAKLFIYRVTYRDDHVIWSNNIFDSLRNTHKNVESVTVGCLSRTRIDLLSRMGAR